MIWVQNATNHHKWSFDQKWFTEIRIMWKNVPEQFCTWAIGSAENAHFWLIQHVTWASPNLVSSVLPEKPLAGAPPNLLRSGSFSDLTIWATALHIYLFIAYHLLLSMLGYFFSFQIGIWKEVWMAWKLKENVSCCDFESKTKSFTEFFKYCWIIYCLFVKVRMRWWVYESSFAKLFM